LFVLIPSLEIEKPDIYPSSFQAKLHIRPWLALTHNGSSGIISIDFDRDLLHYACEPIPNLLQHVSFYYEELDAVDRPEYSTGNPVISVSFTPKVLLELFHLFSRDSSEIKVTFTWDGIKLTCMEQAQGKPLNFFHCIFLDHILYDFLLIPSSNSDNSRYFGKKIKYQYNM
jgi:hypothetical protein